MTPILALIEQYSFYHKILDENPNKVPMRNSAKPQPRCKHFMKEQNRNGGSYTYTEETTQDVYVENPNKEKTTGAHRLQLSLYEKGGTTGDSEATTSSSISSPTSSYNRYNFLSLFISHTLYNV